MLVANLGGERFDTVVLVLRFDTGGRGCSVIFGEHT